MMAYPHHKMLYDFFCDVAHIYRYHLPSASPKASQFYINPLLYEFEPAQSEIITKFYQHLSTKHPIYRDLFPWIDDQKELIAFFKTKLLSEPIAIRNWFEDYCAIIGIQRPQ